MTTKREFFISDIHRPYHNQAAWNVVLKAIRKRKPDTVHIGGDGVDFHSISRHPKKMVERTTLKYEIDGSKNGWSQLRRAAPNAQINYQEGNHDARMQVYLRDRAPELSELPELTFPNLMDFGSFGFRWIPETEKFHIGDLWHHHGHLLPGGGKNPAKTKFSNVCQSIIFGHHHKFDYYSVRQYGTNRKLQSIANAMLYTLEPEYAHHTHWDMGFTEIQYARDGSFEKNQITIDDTGDGGMRAMIDGRIYESSDDENIENILK